MFHDLKQWPPATNNSLPYLIVVRDISVKEGLLDHHQKLLEFGALNDADRLENVWGCEQIQD